MARNLGMDPSRVESLAAQLNAQDSRLSQVAGNMDRMALASTSPHSWGIQPGGLVIAPYSIAATRNAAAQVRLALTAADELIGRLLQEAAQQRLTSNTNSSPARKVGPSKGKKGSPVPGWLRHPAWAWAGGALGAAGWFLVDGVGYLRDPKAVPMFMRKQSQKLGSGLWRYRAGLLQFGRSTYKNNPIRIKFRVPRIPPKLTSSANKVPNWLTKTGRVLGPVGTAITAVSSGASAYDAQWRKSSNLSDGDRHLRSAVAAGTVATGAVGGGLAGAAAGVKIGALVGSIFPGPGTAIGAVAGGIIGGIVGSGIGEKVGSWFNSLW